MATSGLRAQQHRAHFVQQTCPARLGRAARGPVVRCLHKPPQHEQPTLASSPLDAHLRSPLERTSAVALSVECASLASTNGLNGTARSGREPRLRIAVDVDEVLGRFVYALNGFCKAQYDMHYSVGDYWIYEFAKIWGCNQDRSNHIVHEFFKSPHFKDGIPIIPGAFDTLQRLGQWCDLVVVTSRQHVIQDATLEWLDKHYPGTFQEVYFGNHFALEGTSRKKSEICASIGAHVLIDDNVGYALDCASNGIQVLLFDWEGSYPWSKPPAHLSLHPDIQIVRDWAEVEAAIAHMAAARAQTPLPLTGRL